MKILNKWKTIILILLVVTLLFYTIGINTTHKRYVEEDKEQLLRKIDTLISRSKFQMDNIIPNDDNIYIDEKDIEILMMYHTDLERSLFGFKKKAALINKDIDKKFQNIWDNYKYEEETNLEETTIYYENLLKNTKNKDNLTLQDGDIKELEEIYNMYNKIRKDVNNLF